MNKEHYCNEDECKCPNCGSALYYSKKYNQHACSNIKCMWLEIRDFNDISNLRK